jgi:pyruvyltransferase
MATSRSGGNRRTLGRGIADAFTGRRSTRLPSPHQLRRLVEEYRVDGALDDGTGRVPVRWWNKADNFGDLLAPWLVARMTGREVVLGDPDRPHYLVVGSVLNLTTPESVVWGAGSFGVENGRRFDVDATYAAVRGPLSRSRLLARDIACPEASGDPALLAPAFFAPTVRKTHPYGIVARWSERRWADAEISPDVRLIDLATDDVESVIVQILSCRNIVTGSLHGLIMADAYGIPSAWITSQSVYGGPYKFFDYFATVEKMRTAQELDTAQPISAARLRDSLSFDARPISFDHRALLDACPFLVPTSQPADQVAPERPVDSVR